MVNTTKKAPATRSIQSIYLFLFSRRWLRPWSLSFLSLFFLSLSPWFFSKCLCPLSLIPYVSQTYDFLLYLFIFSLSFSFSLVFFADGFVLYRVVSQSHVFLLSLSLSHKQKLPLGPSFFLFSYFLLSNFSLGSATLQQTHAMYNYCKLFSAVCSQCTVVYTIIGCIENL